MGIYSRCGRETIGELFLPIRPKSIAERLCRTCANKERAELRKEFVREVSK